MMGWDGLCEGGSHLGLWAAHWTTHSPFCLSPPLLTPLLSLQGGFRVHRPLPLRRYVGVSMKSWCGSGGWLLLLCWISALWDAGLSRFVTCGALERF